MKPPAVAGLCSLLLAVLCSLGGAVAGENPLFGVSSASNLEHVRAWHFVLRAVPLDRAYWMVDQAGTAGFNTVVVTVTDGVALQSAPWKALPTAWSRAEFEKWAGYARRKGMAVIPEITLLTHQEKFFQNHHTELMFNGDTYDPRNESVYRPVFLLLGEVVEITHAPAVHIGHDELVGYKSSSTEKMLPADLFLHDVLRLHDYLHQRGVGTWMWGDMLISPAEFPRMNPNFMHGGAMGYGRSLRVKLPKDIVICDWHYGEPQTDFPSLAAFKADGFRVLGATFMQEETIRNFSRYAAAHGGDGMIATTWFHVQRQEWAVVDNIIKISGAAFHRDFPDAK